MSDDDVVFDASALLAYLLNERGSEALLFVVQRAVIGTVNLAEVRAKLLDIGGDAPITADMVLRDIRRVEPFTEEDAMTTADLRRTTSHAGLSLGDRACLALALRLGAEVYTADNAWSRVSVGCQIHMVR